MRKKYIKPEMEISEFDLEDIITTSNEGGYQEEDEEEEEEGGD
jgi:hypothetical protein